MATVVNVAGLLADGTVTITGTPTFTPVALTVAAGQVTVPDANLEAFYRAFPSLRAGNNQLTPDRPPATTNIISVLDYGADPTGAADSTTAIRNAIAAAYDADNVARNVVYFPAGTYRVTSAIELDYGITLQGASAAASVVKMDPTVLADLFVGKVSGGFPVYITFDRLTLDGGLSYTAGLKTTLPTSSGTIGTTGTYTAGTFTTPLTTTAGTVSVRWGDVLRLSGHPATFSVNGADVASGALYTPGWSPASTLTTPQTWQVYKAGNLISGNLGRLTVRDCRLLNAKRHCIDLSGAGSSGGPAGGGGEHRIVRSTIGSSQGCGLFGNGFGDGAVENCWFVETGGANVYAYNAFDFPITDCLLEGAGVANVVVDAGELTLGNCQLWGGRQGNIVAGTAGWVRVAQLKLRDPGTGGTSTLLGSTSFQTITGRPAIEVGFGSSDYGIVATNIVLASTKDPAGAQINPTGPLVKINNGSRSMLSAITDVATGITYSGGIILSDAGTTTIVRGFRGVTDKN